MKRFLLLFFHILFLILPLPQNTALLNILIALRLVFPIYLICTMGQLLVHKLRLSPEERWLASFGVGAVLNYLLFLVLGRFDALTFPILSAVYLLVFFLSSPLPDMSLKKEMLFPLLLLLPIVFFQIFSSSYLWLDMLPYTAQSQQIISFNSYDPFNNNPAPNYPKHQVLPLTSTLFAELGILGNLSAFDANAGFLIFQNMFLLLGLYLVARRAGSSIFSLAFLILTYVWTRSSDVRGTTVAFIFLAGVLYFHKSHRLLPFFLAACLLSNPTIGLLGYVWLCIYYSFRIMTGREDTASILKPTMLSFFLSILYIYSNVNQSVTLFQFILFALFSGLLYAVAGKPRFRLNLSDGLVKPVSVILVFILFPWTIYTSYPLLTTLALISLIVSGSFAAISGILSPLIVIRLVPFLSVIPFFQVGNFVSKAQEYGLSFFLALACLYLEPFLKKTFGKTASYLFIFILLVTLLIPRLEEVRDAHSEISYIDKWKWAFQSIERPFLGAKRETDGIYGAIMIEIKEGRLKQTSIVENHIPSLDISLHTGAYEVVIIGSKIEPSQVSSFRHWAIDNEIAPRIYREPVAFDSDYIIDYPGRNLTKVFEEGSHVLYRR